MLNEKRAVKLFTFYELISCLPSDTDWPDTSVGHIIYAHGNAVKYFFLFLLDLRINECYHKGS